MDAEGLFRKFLETFISSGSLPVGMEDTPRRYLAALSEMLAGYDQDPKQILCESFDVQSDEIIALQGIRFSSLCEHHLLPFTGTAMVAYLPHKEGGVVGISKLARVVECYSQRFQIQERLTRQIAEAINQHLEPQGVGVIIKAHHLCMGCRGVKQLDTTMVTSCMLGVFRDDLGARQELLALVP